MTTLIRLVATVAIGLGLAALTGVVLWQAAGKPPIRFSQPEEAELPHHHPLGAEDTVHHHGSTADGSVQVVLQTRPESLQAGAHAELVFALSDISGQPVAELVTHHARKLHVVIVSDDMQMLGHIHPQDFKETFEEGTARVFFTFPHAGRYLIAVDFMTARGFQDEQFIVEVEGGRVEPAPAVKAPPSIVSAKMEADDIYTEPASLQAMDQSRSYGISLQRPDAIRAGEAVTFTYRFRENEEPLSDLAPYLDAPMHLAVVKDDLTGFLHTHGTIPGDAHAGHTDGHHVPDSFGPEIAANVTFPEPGTYYLFAQSKHGNRLLISRFPVQVD